MGRGNSTETAVVSAPRSAPAGRYRTHHIYEGDSINGVVVREVKRTAGMMQFHMEDGTTLSFRPGDMVPGATKAKRRASAQTAPDMSASAAPVRSSANFSVRARRIEILPMENADALELARIKGTDFVAVVPKGKYSDDELIVYIPEQAILPAWLIEAEGLVRPDGGTSLAGGTFDESGRKIPNRLKAIRLRGQLSQGLVFRPDPSRIPELVEGEDYAEQLDIEKYAPPVPTSLAGRAHPAPGLRAYTDITNIKNAPHVLADGEPVVATEKLHGTNSLWMRTAEGEMIVSSKGVAGRQMGLLETDDNAYWKMARAADAERLLAQIAERFPGEDVTLFGEIVGVQDLRYGAHGGDLDWRAFDIRVGDRYLDIDQLNDICQQLNIPQVPLIYEGPYDRARLDELATGREQMTGRETNIREGLVVRPVRERRDDSIGRVIVKFISPKYLLRKGDATEFE
jgi:RNA ligase (TIGR02306 family)